ncbi:MAG: glycosyltransferase [Candidatus Nanosalina sp.]
MRMISIVERLESKNYEVKVAGGGPGEKFLRERGRSPFSPTTTDTRRNLEKNLFSAALYQLTDPLSRIKELEEWIALEDPEVILTDDPPAIIAARKQSKDFYYLNHGSKSILGNRLEGWLNWVANKLIVRAAEEFFYPSVWDDEEPKGAEVVGPLAPEGNEEVEGFDILIVPSEFDSGQDWESIKENLDEYGVRLVGGDDWDIKESLQPYIREADVVVCSGYSTIMEAAVAGTSCIIAPATSEQRGIAEVLDGYKGFRKFSGDIRKDISEVEDPEPMGNGADKIADIIDKDLSE